jgi:hypothetical protein
MMETTANMKLLQITLRPWYILTRSDRTVAVAMVTAATMMIECCVQAPIL